MRKAGGNFKEKFREHGGLDAVFDVTRQCHLNMKVRALHGLNLFIPQPCCICEPLYRRYKNGSKGRKFLQYSFKEGHLKISFGWNA